MSEDKSGDWPPQPVEVDDVSPGVKIQAIGLGSAMLLAKEFEDPEQLEKLGDDLYFASAFLSLSKSYNDPVYQLARLGIAMGDTYEEAVEQYKAFCGGAVPDLNLEERQKLIDGLACEHDRQVDELLDQFHRANEDLTVFLTEDGRIAVGRYPAE